MNSSMFSNQRRLAGLAVAVVALVLAIVAAATKGWIQYTVGNVEGGIGLFQTCVTSGGASNCGNTIDLPVNECNSPSEFQARVRVSQAFVVLAVLLTFACIAAVVLRVLTSARRASTIAIGAVSAAGTAMLIAFAVHLDTFWRFYGCGRSLCATTCALCSSCGVHFSLGLAVASWVLLFVAGVLIKTAHNSASDAPDASAATQPAAQA